MPTMCTRPDEGLILVVAEVLLAVVRHCPRPAGGSRRPVTRYDRCECRSHVAIALKVAKGAAGCAVARQPALAGIPSGYVARAEFVGPPLVCYRCVICPGRG